MVTTSRRPLPVVADDYCKGCGRCIAACAKHCLSFGHELDPATGLVPIHLDLTDCNGCGLCVEACPEPYGLQAGDPVAFEPEDPAGCLGPRHSTAPEPVEIPGHEVDVASRTPLLVKGTYAAALGALLAGCRHVYGYPITPSTEGAELCARLLPDLGGTFVQAVSEVATVNMLYGAGGAGRRAMTFTSSPGFSLMLEGISYLIGAEVPAVIVNVMRAGPGLGNIGPEQGDVKLVCRGLGHGNTHAIVLAPSTPQEMLDLTMEAFDLAFAYRNPVIVVADGYLGQMTGVVKLPTHAVVPGTPAWAVTGDLGHRANLICSIELSERALEHHNESLCAKYDAMTRATQRSERYHCDDAEILIVAANTPARLAKGAVAELRHGGVAAGLFRPITLWPFPIDDLIPLLPHVRHLVVAEASAGQLEDELRLALSHAGVNPPSISHVRRMGGVLPSSDEVVAHVTSLEEGR